MTLIESASKIRRIKRPESVSAQTYEAVRRLEEEGFVEVIEGRARLVATITPGKVLQLYELRCVLEKFAADRAQGLISSEALDRVTGKFDDLLVELDRANVIPFNNCD